MARFSHWLLVIIVITFDQLTKLAVRRSFQINEYVIIPKFLSLTYITNTGASFGILRGMNTLLMIIGLAVVIFLLYYINKSDVQAKTSALALITGGAISNIIDRIAYGHVIDFINFSFWPAFNIADSAITIGIGILIIQHLREKLNRASTPK